VAKKVFKGARNFRPAKRLGQTIGWTFFIPRDKEVEDSHDAYSWVDLFDNVPSDTYGTASQAGDFLRSYWKTNRHVSGRLKGNALEKRT
jgi:hypothetical protein